MADDAVGAVRRTPRPALLPRLAELAEQAGKLRTAEWLRACALLQPEEWPPAPAYKGPMVSAAARDTLQQTLDLVRAQNDDVVQQVDTALGHRYHKPGLHYSVPHIAEKAAADLDLLLWLHAELQHKLTRPCGECHPCTNWADETWRRAGRKPPSVVTWEDKLAETRGLYARLDDAIKLIEEMAGHLRQDAALTIGVETRLAALQGYQPAEPTTPGGFPYRQQPHRLAGNNADRQSLGQPGHCEDCASVGHVVAHPELGCGDVSCYVTHGDEEPTGEVDRG